MTAVVPADQLRARVAADEFLGYELHATRQLISRLPVDACYDHQDITAWMRLYALEAADAYNPNSRAKFGTFLFRHLQIRSMQWFNWAWSKYAHPEGHCILHISALSSEEPFDPVDTHRDFPKEIEELLRLLSPAARSIFDKIIGIGTSRDLAFENICKHPRRYGVQEIDIMILRDEVEVLQRTYALS